MSLQNSGRPMLIAGSEQLHCRRLVDEMKSSLAVTTALQSLNTALEVSISRIERQFELQADALARFPTLLVRLADAVVCCLNFSCASH